MKYKSMAAIARALVFAGVAEMAVAAVPFYSESFQSQPFGIDVKALPAWSGSVDDLSVVTNASGEASDPTRYLYFNTEGTVLTNDFVDTDSDINLVDRERGIWIDFSSKLVAGELLDWADCSNDASKIVIYAYQETSASVPLLTIMHRVMKSDGSYLVTNSVTDYVVNPLEVINVSLCLKKFGNDIAVKVSVNGATICSANAYTSAAIEGDHNGTAAGGTGVDAFWFLALDSSNEYVKGLGFMGCGTVDNILAYRFDPEKTTPVANTVPVPLTWIESIIGSGKTEAEYDAATLAEGVNGLKRWESYALGLNPEDASSKLFVASGADTSVDTLTIVPAGVGSTPSGVDVSYIVEGKESETAGEWTALPNGEVKLPSQYKIFRVKAAITSED